MEKMKRYRVHLAAFAILAVLLLTFVFGAFSQNGDTAESSGAGVTVDLTAAGETVDIVKDGATNYTIIYAGAGIMQDDATVAGALRSLFTTLGVSSVSSKPDFNVAKVGDYEVLIGDTDRAYSKTLTDIAKSTAEEGDQVWIIAEKDGKLYYTANSNGAILRGKNDLFAFAGDNSFSVPKDYYQVHIFTKAQQDEEYRNNAALRIEELKKQIAAFVNTDFTQGEIMDLDFTRMPESDFGNPLQYPSEGEHPRVNLTPATLEYMKEYVTTTDEGKRMYDAMVEYANRPFDGILEEPYMHETGRIGYHNVDETGLAIIEARAFLYLITEDPEWGYKAVLSMKNYLKTFRLGYIYSDQCREFGRTMFVTAEIYDWCYDLLTPADKEQFIVACTYIASGSTATRYGGKWAGAEYCASGDLYMEVGYPPNKQGSVAGHGAEAQILRDYLSISIAIFDENPTWYNYVAARIYNDFIPFRDYYFQSGMYPQGVFNYAPHRHASDTWSAWMLYCATGENPYSDDLQRVSHGFLEFVTPDGSLFGTGDGSRPTGVNSKQYIVYIITITAALYGDPGLRDEVLDVYNGSMMNLKTGAQTTFSTVHQIIFSAEYWRKTGSLDVTEFHDGKDPINYHSYPIGQMIARSEWENPDAAASFMLVGEVTTSNHEHADCGTFQLFYKGLYFGESGVYDKYGSTHWRYYHQSTVAHNGILLFNPEQADYELAADGSNLARVFYSGGQRHFTSAGDDLNGWLANTNNVKAEVTAHQYGLNADGSADYAYLAGDLSKAYVPLQASYVGRRMLTLFTDDEEHPMYFIVYDSISAASENIVSKFLLHTPLEPIIDGENKTVSVVGEEARLVLRALKGADKIEKIGGNNNPALWEEGDRNYLINGVQCASTKNDDNMWGRVEISNTGKTNTEFFNVMYFTDEGNEEVLDIELFDNEIFIGTKVDNSYIVFTKSPDKAGEEFTVNTEGKGLSRYLIIGLVEGSWDIDVDGVTVAHCVSTEEGGTISFYAPSGEVRVKPGKDIAPANGGRVVYNTYGGLVIGDAPTTYIVDEPLKLPTEVVRGNDQFLGWYTSPEFDEDSLVVGEFYPIEKGKVTFYAKYRSFPVKEDFDGMELYVENANSNINGISYLTRSKPGSVYEVIDGEEAGTGYLRASNTEKDFQIDAASKTPAEYMGFGETKLTFEVDLATEVGKKSLNSSFMLREQTTSQRVTLFSTTVLGEVKVGNKVVMHLGETFQKIIVTADFENSLITAYNRQGEVLNEFTFTVPTASTAKTTLEWLSMLGQTFNWWMGSGNGVLLIDNIRVYCGEFSAEEYKLESGTNYVNYFPGTGDLPPDVSTVYKAGEAFTLPRPTPTGEREMFEGWYTTQSFEDGTKIEGGVLNMQSAAEPINLYAKYIMPEGMNRVIYSLGAAVLPEDAPLVFYKDIDLILPTPTVENGVFIGWYTTPDFKDGTKVEGGVINISSSDEPLYLYARCSIVAYDNDFTDSKVDFSADTGSKPEENISYGLDGKTGSTAKAVTDANGNTYIEIYTDAKDATINQSATIKDVHAAVVNGGGKITYEIDLATHPDGRVGTTSFRPRSTGGASDSINIFTTEKGVVYLNAKTDLPVGELSKDLTKFIFTLDIYEETLTAYDIYGFEIASIKVSVPKVSEESYATVEDWFLGTTYTFNWHVSSGGGIAYDNLKIYGGAYITDLVVPENSGRLVLDFGEGVYGGEVPVYYTAGVDLTLPVPTINDTYRVFKGWYTTPDFKDGTKIEGGVLNLDNADGAVTLYARYALPDNMNYIEYEAGDAVLPTDAPTVYQEGVEVILPTPVPNNEYETFFGWYETPDFAGEKITSFTLSSAESVKKLYAKFVLVEGVNRIEYVLGDAVLSEDAPKFYEAGKELKLPIPTLSDANYKTVFVGWYDNPEFEGECITAINRQSADGKITLYARFKIIFIDADFNDSEAKIEGGNGVIAGATQSFDGVYYQFNGKYAGVAVEKDALGNAYIRIHTDVAKPDGGTGSCDPQSEVRDANGYAKNAIIKNGGKVTYSLDIKIPEDGTLGSSEFRLRASSSSDCVKMLWIKEDGNVYLNGNSQKKIATLDSGFTRIVFTLDVVNATITAYDAFGDAIETDTVKIPLSSKEGQLNYGKFASFFDWYKTTGSLYQWYFSRGNDIAYDNLTIYAGEFTDYLKMPENSNKIYFVSGGGDITGEIPLYYTAGTALTLPTVVPNTAGLVFRGWYDNPEFNGEPMFSASFDSADEAVTLYARIGLPEGIGKLDYVLGDGTVDGELDEYFEVGEPIALPTPTPMSKYEKFDGWYLDADYSGEKVTELIPTDDRYGITLYAKYILADGVNKINYNLDGTLPENAPYYYTRGELIKLPVPTKDGAVFFGWYTSADFNSASLVNEIYKDNTDEAVTLYARFLTVIDFFKDDFEDSDLAGYTDATLSNNGSDAANKIIDGISYGFQNKTCSATLKDSSGNKYVELYTPETKVSGSCDPTITVSSKDFTTKVIEAGGRITYELDMATLSDGRVGESTFRIRETGGTSSDVIIIFKTASDGKVYLGGKSDKCVGQLTAELTRYVFTLDIYEETLSLIDEYGDVTESIPVSVPATTKTGATTVAEWFKNVGNLFQWYFNSNGGVAYDNIYVHSGDYKVSESVLPKGQNRVFFELGGGTLDIDATVLYKAGEELTLPTPTPPGEGLEFVGWYDNPYFIGEARSTLLMTDATSPVRLYAKYEMPDNMNYLEFEAGDGNLPADAPKYYTVGEEITLPTPTKTASYFRGWYLTEDFSGEAIKVLLADKADEPIKLYARFSSILLEQDFTNSTLDSKKDDYNEQTGLNTADISKDNLNYNVKNKQGSSVKVVTEGDNKYLVMRTDGEGDVTVRNYNTAKEKAPMDFGKVTYEVSVAAVEGTAIVSNGMSIRGPISSSDTINLFAITATGKVYLNYQTGKDEYCIGTLSKDFLKIIITIDIYEETVTAYNTDGSVIASINVKVPTVGQVLDYDKNGDGEISVAEWHANAGYLFNWHMSKGGGLAIDNFKIYSGEYVAP